MANRYIEVRPKHWQGYYLQGRAYYRLGKYEQARKSLRRAAEAHPGEVVVRLLIADTYSLPARKAVVSGTLPQLQEAVEEFRREFRRVPDKSYSVMSW